MNKNKLIAIVATCLLVTGIFAVLPAFSVQPPVNTATYFVGTIGQPRRLDPARAYDTASGEIIQNVYQPLIFFGDKPIAPDADTDIGANPALVADLGNFVPMLAKAMPYITPDGKHYTFEIDPAAIFHPWTAANGSVIPSRALTVYDVEYSFKRMLVQDCLGAPSWMIALPCTGYMFYDALDPNPATNGFDGAEATVAALINAVVTVNNATHVTLNLVSAWPQTAMFQILSQTWGCIVNKDFCIEHGCWDGSFAAGWSTNYRRMPSNSYTPLDRYYSKSKYPSSAPDVPNMCGTGPYKFSYWDRANLEWRVDYFPTYWKGWANAGNGGGVPGVSYFTAVVEKGIAAWPTRKMLFLQGEYDVCAVPRANMYDLLVSQFVPISGIRLYYNTPALSNDVASFVLDIAADSPYQSKVKGTVVNDFFAYSSIRRAFCQALNFTSYLADAWFNEAIQPATWWVQGLKPDYEDKTITKWNLNTAAIQTELTNTIIPESSPDNLWTTGFETYLVYNLGNDQRRIACEMIQQTFTSLGSKYKVNVVGLDWPVFLDYEESFYMPFFFVGWLADFADADNFARPYMHSQGDFSYFQGYGNSTIDALIDGGITTPDGPARNATYQTLQQIYHYDSPGLPLIQAVGRRWARDWVKGWYYNQLYPGLYAYDLYKSAGALGAVDLDATATITQGPGVAYNRTLIFNGGMYLGFEGGTAHLLAPAGMNYTLSVKYNAGGAVPNLVASIGLKRNSSLETQYPNGDYVVLSPGQTGTKILWWQEDGTNQIVLADYASEGTTHTGTAYTVSIESFPVNGQDSNLANNVKAYGIWNASRLVGDIKSDGLVDIFDAIQLSNAFGATTGQARFNANADLKADGVIDIFDAILLSSNFNKHVP